MKQIVLDYTPFCTRAAYVEDGELLEFSVEKTSVRGLVGNIYKGKVENVLGGMKAAFVNIGLERNGFLYVGDSLVDSKGLHNAMPQKHFNISAGDTILCQVVKDQFGQKGARLTTDITLPGYYIVFLPTSDYIGVSRKIENVKRREYLEQYVKSICPVGMGAIIRTAAENASDIDIKREISRLAELWSKIEDDFKRAQEKSLVFEDASLFERALRETFSEDIDTVVVNDEMVAKQLEGKVGKAKIEVYNGARNIMAHFNLSSQINHLCDHNVVMPNGAYIVIDKTEALTVIDVNTGKYVGTTDLEDTVYKTNLSAAECIAKQLRLRNISGIVIIDFIDMQRQEHRDAVIEKLKEALKHDRQKTATIGMTSLGLVELTRKKTRLPVDDFMLQPHKDCQGGFVISSEHLAFMLRDELVDFIIANRCDEAYVGLNPEIFATAIETKIMQRQISTVWKNKKIYLYCEDVARDKFDISTKAPENTPIDMILLGVNDEQTEEQPADN